MTGWIMTLFGDSLALLTFFSIFAGGMVYTLFSIAFGGDADHDFEIDHDIHVDVGHGDVGHDGVAAGDDVHDVHAPGVFSIRGIALLMTGFGGIAYLIQLYTERILFASVGGLMAGWVFAFLCTSLLTMFYRQQGSSQIKPTQIVGSYGVVSVRIPDDGGLGEVQLIVLGTQMNKPATSESGQDISRHTRVRVVNYVGGSVVVSTLDPKS